MADVSKKVLESRIRNEVIKNRVHSILLDRPCARGDDLVLALEFYRRYYPHIRSLWDLELASFKGLVPTPDTISRRRRELVYDEGHSELLPSLGTQRKRLKNAGVYCDFYGQARNLWDFEVLE